MWIVVLRRGLLRLFRREFLFTLSSLVATFSVMMLLYWFGNPVIGKNGVPFHWLPEIVFISLCGSCMWLVGKKLRVNLFGTLVFAVVFANVLTPFVISYMKSAPLWVAFSFNFVNVVFLCLFLFVGYLVRFLVFNVWRQ